MKSYCRNALGCIGLGLLLAGANASAQLVDMQLIGPPPGSPNMGGVYTSPYTALIGPPGQPGTPTLIICDDFLTDVSIGDKWTATVTNMSALAGESNASSAVKFDQTATANTQIQDYMTIAQLAEDLLGINQSSPAGATLAGQYSFAIWAVFDPSSLSTLGSTDYSQANALLTAARLAVAHLNPTDFSNVDIYTPAPVQSVSQEYITVRADEASSLGLLTLDLFGMGGLLFLFRRRLFGVN